MSLKHLVGGGVRSVPSEVNVRIKVSTNLLVKRALFWETVIGENSTRNAFVLFPNCCSLGARSVQLILSRFL